MSLIELILYKGCSFYGKKKKILFRVLMLLCINLKMVYLALFIFVHFIRVL
uniref:Uncharacterized protein n=1 Tax=Anguilla anguilla TaxID=7936 RepID=A0A0E9XND6_ANGAN